MKHKILIPAYDFKPALGGVANYVHEIASAWSKMGHSITVLARKHPQSESFDSHAPYKVIRIQSPQTAIFSLIPFSFAIRKFVNFETPDFIFCPLWFPDAAATLLSRTVPKTPFFIAVHASEIFFSGNSLKHKLRGTLLQKLQYQVFEQAQKIFAVSHYTKSELLKLPGTKTEKISVANNGVNPELFYKKNFSTPIFNGLNLANKKILLTVTRLHPYKGVDAVIKTLPQVLLDVPDLHYLVVGEGPDRQRLESLTQSLGLSSYVSFLGALESSKIFELYNRSTLFVMLSREELPDVEGFGLVFLEAAACGLPSLGGHSGGIPDAIDDLRSGWLVNPNSTHDICQKLIHLLKAPDVLQKASQYCLQTAPQKTWLKTATDIMTAIDE